MRWIALAATAAALLVAAPAASAWTPPRPVATGSPQGLGIDRGGRVVLLAMGTSSLADPFPQLHAVRGPGSGPLAVQRLATSVAGARLAVADTGHAAAVWVAPRRSCGNSLNCLGYLRVATRRPGGRFGRPVTLSNSAYPRPSVAVGERGEVLVAALRGQRDSGFTAVRGTVLVASKRPGRAWRTQTLAASGYSLGDLGLGMAPNGSAVVMWGFHSGRPGSEGATYVASRRGHGSFGARRLLLRRLGSDFAALVEPAGGALVVWRDREPYRQVLAARRTASGAWLPPRFVGRGGEPRLSADRAGRAVVLWSDHRPAPGGFFPDSDTFAAGRPPGGAFSAPTAILPVNSTAAHAVAPGGRTVVAWTSRPAQPDGPTELRVGEMVGTSPPGAGEVLAPRAGGQRVAVSRAGPRALAFAAGSRVWLSTQPGP